MEYGVAMGDHRIGEAEVFREGLYYRIRCRVRLSGKVLCKVLVSCGTREDNLGVLVPEGDAFVLETRIPVKRLGEGELRFRVLPRHTELKGRFVPLAPEEPFRYLSRLKDARLVRRGDVTGILIEEKDCG